MKALLVKWGNRIRDSYWFVPSLMALAAIVLSFVTTALDNRLGSAWLEDISWLYANKPAGARAVLSTVAGSMITVAGVTFSMTILSISHTTAQVGPRLLNNFMRDRGNQITLGVFISTFLYCLMVLRTVRNADSPPPGGSSSDAELASAFVPHIAIILALMLAIASVGVLIYFIHHIPESIHVSNIIAGVGYDMNRQIHKQFPSRLGDPRPEKSDREIDADLPKEFYQSAKKVYADGVGYVEFVDVDGLMEVARKHDLVIRMRFRPGDFVTKRNVLMLAAPQSRVSDDVAAQLNATFVRGMQRTKTQNLGFVMNQLVEVAMRALSPGVNDPFTAMNCMDWLQSGLENLAERDMPDAHRYDKEKKLRVVIEPETFSFFSNLVFDQLRPYVAVDRNASIHMIEMLAKLSMMVSSDVQRRHLIRHGGALRRACKQTINDPRFHATLAQRYRSMIWSLRDPNYRMNMLACGQWIDQDKDAQPTLR